MKKGEVLLLTILLMGAFLFMSVIAGIETENKPQEDKTTLSDVEKWYTNQTSAVTQSLMEYAKSIDGLTSLEVDSSKFRFGEDSGWYDCHYTVIFTCKVNGTTYNGEARAFMKYQDNTVNWFHFEIFSNTGVQSLVEHYDDSYDQIIEDYYKELESKYGSNDPTQSNVNSSKKSVLPPSKELVIDESSNYVEYMIKTYVIADHPTFIYREREAVGYIDSQESENSWNTHAHIAFQIINPSNFKTVNGWYEVYYNVIATPENDYKFQRLEKDDSYSYESSLFQEEAKAVLEAGLQAAGINGPYSYTNVVEYEFTSNYGKPYRTIIGDVTAEGITSEFYFMMGYVDGEFLFGDFRINGETIVSSEETTRYILLYGEK